MAAKKKISEAKMNLIIEDLIANLGDWTDSIIKETLSRHFEIVEIDADEIECSPMGNILDTSEGIV